ncbi:MBOAT family O-acyltransferase [Fontibacillus sp. BL9]|uniref:MBOAT family O-acyltransferase n=1 Tax=Fontibacillus sp. BL9 TaxID=3389971 RepID=UPI00397E438B
MVFSSSLFMFYFLPIVLIAYFFIDPKFKNHLLLLASLFFYSWGETKALVLIIISLILNFFLGLIIDSKRANKWFCKGTFIVAIVLNIGILVFYKYLGFIFDIALSVINIFPHQNTLNLSFSIPLPIGISFYTFHILSYIIDVYKNKAPVQKNIIDHGLYIFFFPQLIAGPIIRYNDIVDQLKNRNSTLDDVIYGAKRFIIGFSKKVLIANNAGLIADNIFNSNLATLPQGISWIGIFAYTVQIYYDFSAYSDMAIGLARIFGFRFKENFNYPYYADSVQDFWRRWHISLSRWFKDYVYIPLGGNRKGIFQTHFNKMVVFILCGLWHGASWNFLFWGFYYGVFLTVEGLFLGKILSKTWKPLRHIYTWLVVMVGWVFFRTETMNEALIYLKKMFWFNGTPFYSYIDIFKFWDKETMVLGILALLFCFPIYHSIERRLQNKNWRFLKPFGYLGLYLVFLISLLYLVNSSYNPFIYFRF